MIRNFTKEDAQEVSDLVALTLRTSNIKDYSAERIEADVLIFNAQYLINRMSWTNGYVYCDGAKIVGCVFIGHYWDKKDEACLFTFFVHPDYQGKGIGRQLMNAVEQDEIFLRSKRIEIPDINLENMDWFSGDFKIKNVEGDLIVKTVSLIRE